MKLESRSALDIISGRMPLENKPADRESPTSRKIGVSVPLVSQRDFKQSVDVIQRYRDTQAGHVELWLEEDLDRFDLPEVKRALGGLACSIHAPFVDFSLVTPDPLFAQASKRKLERSIAVAESLDAKVVTVHPGKWSVIGSHDEACERLVARLGALQETTAIPLAVENLKPQRSGVQRNLVTSADDFDKLLSLNANLPFTFDVGHALQSGIDIPATMRMLENNVHNIHLHGLSPTGSSHVGATSTVQASELLGHIAEAPPGALVTLEVLDDDAQLRTLEFAVRAERQYLRRAS